MFYQIIIVLSARKLAEASFNEHKNLDDINVYQINIVLSALELAQVASNKHKKLDDINVCQTMNIKIWTISMFTK